MTRPGSAWAAPATLKLAAGTAAVAGLVVASVSPAVGALVGPDTEPVARAAKAAVSAPAVVAPTAPGPAQAPAGVLTFRAVAKPKPKPKPAPVVREQAASRDSGRTAAVGAAGGGDTGLTRSNFSGTGIGGLGYNARRVFVSVMNNFPAITSVIGVRPDSIPDHPSGRAVDFMIPNWGSGSGEALGNAIVSHVQANAGRWNVDYIIFRQRIWFPGSGWRSMSDRGSPTANHYDHVHVSTR